MAPPRIPLSRWMKMCKTNDSHRVANNALESVEREIDALESVNSEMKGKTNSMEGNLSKQPCTDELKRLDILMPNDLNAARKGRADVAVLLESPSRHHTNTTHTCENETESDVESGNIDGVSLQQHHHTQSYSLEQLETGKKTSVELAEHSTRGCPRHAVGCTEYECHGALMEKKGFGKVQDSYGLSIEEKLRDSVAFLTQYAQENENVYGNSRGGGLENRLRQVQLEIESTGTYVQTFDELQYGCRLAWRNSGRCIMRKVSFTLELLDCRSVRTAEEAYDKIVKHLAYAANGGVIKPVISVFAPKEDGKSAPVRIWNSQLIGYAAYERPDGSIQGDPARLALTSLCVKYGWKPPEDSLKSDFDILPLLISDEKTGHDKPKVFKLSPDVVLEVPIEHPQHAAFADLNLRWYALPAISNMGVDIGGCYYQTCPFNGWYSVTEIGRDFLDKQRYDLAAQIAVVCNIPRTTLAVWKDDVQLQVHRAILHSFAKEGVSLVDHHTASDSFIGFYQEEIKQRGKCPADWVWLVPPAGGSMTSVFHQEMFNFFQKPQYRVQEDLWNELNVDIPQRIRVNLQVSCGVQFDRNACIYDQIVICYGSETGMSLKYAATIVQKFGEHCEGPIRMDDVPLLLERSNSCNGKKRNLLLVCTSTFGKGSAPNGASAFLPQLEQFPNDSITGWDFAVFALGNSAYMSSFVNFGIRTHEALIRVGCRPAMKMYIADELKNQDDAYQAWHLDVMDNQSGILYNRSKVSDKYTLGQQQVVKKISLVYTGCAPLTQTPETLQKKLDEEMSNRYNESWTSHADTLIRSTDLFSFKVNDLDSYNLQPGDHVALYPQNDSCHVELALGLCIIDDLNKLEEYRLKTTEDIDLNRPLPTSSLYDLMDKCANQGASQKVLRLIISNSTHNANDSNNPSNTNPTAAMLINLLPPKSIPIQWLLLKTPDMMPRFFSISSIDEDEITITQSAFHFAHSNKVGTTSKWLRTVIKPGDIVDAVFSITDFHLPAHDTVPVILVGVGSGIAPFRAFWLAEKNNPIHLFLGFRKESELPFKEELAQLEDTGRLALYPAYSRGDNPQYVQNKLWEEAQSVRELLTNQSTKVYVCGNPEVEYQVREVLISILEKGLTEKNIPGMDIIKATMALARMKLKGRYITEVYGKSSRAQASSPMAKLWDECLAVNLNIKASLERMDIPKARAHNSKRNKLNVSREPSRREKGGKNINSVMTKRLSWSAHDIPSWSQHGATYLSELSPVVESKHSLDFAEEDDTFDTTSFVPLFCRRKSR